MAAPPGLGRAPGGSLDETRRLEAAHDLPAQHLRVQSARGVWELCGARWNMDGFLNRSSRLSSWAIFWSTAPTRSAGRCERRCGYAHYDSPPKSAAGDRALCRFLPWCVRQYGGVAKLGDSRRELQVAGQPADLLAAGVLNRPRQVVMGQQAADSPQQNRKPSAKPRLDPSHLKKRCPYEKELLSPLFQGRWSAD